MTAALNFPTHLLELLNQSRRRWLVTGAAGFIGSNLVETLLLLDQEVVAMDNLVSGKMSNIDQVRKAVGKQRAGQWLFIEGDIRSNTDCAKATDGVDVVLHQAALGSVPRSISDPLATHDHNVTGFLTLLRAVCERKIKRFVYASSSSVYGDDPGLPKVEHKTGNLLSPYAASKYSNELYAAVFSRCYGVETVGLRYFNVFGKRQDPEGAYAAVIPVWVKALLSGKEVYINGDGLTSRDFCYVDNAVQANLLAATTSNFDAVNTVFNVAVQDQTSLNEMFEILRDLLAVEIQNPSLHSVKPIYRDFRAGDIRHSNADISKAQKLLGYSPSFKLADGLKDALNWYVRALNPRIATKTI